MTKSGEEPGNRVMSARKQAGLTQVEPAAIAPRWSQLAGAGEPREAAIHLSAEFGTSWSATCAQLHRLGCITASQFEQLGQRKPTGSEFLERELRIQNDVPAPLVPPGYAAAVIRALKRAKISADHALELLHGTLDADGLPAEKPLSLEAMTAELEPLPG